MTDEKSLVIFVDRFTLVELLYHRLKRVSCSTTQWIALFWFKHKREACCCLMVWLTFFIVCRRINCSSSHTSQWTENDVLPIVSLVLLQAISCPCISPPDGWGLLTPFGSQAPGRRSVERALCSNQMKQKTLTTKPLRRARTWCGEVGGRLIDFLKVYLGRQRRRRNSYRKRDHKAHSGSRPPATIHARESNNKYSARSYFCK